MPVSLIALDLEERAENAARAKENIEENSENITKTEAEYEVQA